MDSASMVSQCQTTSNGHQLNVDRGILDFVLAEVHSIYCSHILNVKQLS